MKEQRIKRAFFCIVWSFLILLGFHCINNSDPFIDGEEKIIIQQRFKPVLEEYTSISLENIPPPEGIEQFSHRGQIAVIDGNTGQLHWWHFSSLPKGLRATRPEDVKTLVVITTSEQHLFSYNGSLIRTDGSRTNGIPVYRETISVKIIDIKAKATLATSTFRGAGKNSFPDKATITNIAPRMEGGWYVLEEVNGHRNHRIFILKDDSGEPYGITDADSSEALYEKMLDFVVDAWDDSVTQTINT